MEGKLYIPKHTQIKGTGLGKTIPIWEAISPISSCPTDYKKKALRKIPLFFFF